MVWLKRILGLIGCGSLQWRWLRFDVIQDLLDYVWVSDVDDDAHGAITQWAWGNNKIKDSPESLIRLSSTLHVIVFKPCSASRLFIISFQRIL